MTCPDDNPLPYILTPEEEKKAIEWAIIQKQKLFVWKRTEMREKISQIEAKIDKIDWEKEIDKDEVLSTANKNKHRQIDQETFLKENKANEEKRKKDLQVKCDANYMYQLMCKTSFYEFGKRIKINDDFLDLVRVICFFLSRDKRFETDYKFDFNKGLWLLGPTGRGKTHVAKCLRNNEVLPISIFSMIDITEEIKKYGYFDLPFYDMLYLDDVGTEELDSKNYGSRITFFKNFIEQTYLRRKTFENIMVSTNNSFDDIESRYGFRVRSRVRDMFNIYHVKGIDFRGNV